MFLFSFFEAGLLRLTNEHAHFQKRNQKLAHSPPSHLLPQLTSSCCRYASYYDVIFWKLRKRANLRKNDTLQDSKEYWNIGFFSKFQQEQQQWAYLHDYNNTALQKHKKGGSWKHEASSMRAQKGIMKVYTTSLRWQCSMQKKIRVATLRQRVNARYVTFTLRI